LISYDVGILINIDELIIKEGNQCNQAKLNGANCKKCIFTIINVVKVFGVLEVDSIEHFNSIRVKSETAKYFLMSLSEYISNDISLLSKWHKRDGVEPIINEKTMFTGPLFLFNMEKNRIEKLSEPKTFRFVLNGRVVIKTKKKEDVILYQYDPKSYEYKTIGGSIEKDDISIRDAAIREFNEELKLTHMKYMTDYKLKEFYTCKHKKLSSSTGAYSDYEPHFFHAYDFDASKLELSETERWISIREIKNKVTDNGVKIYYVDDEFVEELERLSYSFRRKFKLLEVIKNRKWEVVGIFIGILSLLITIIVSK